MALELEKIFPDLFTGMTTEEIQRENDLWANQWLEGWQPDREQVKLGLMRRHGELTMDEFIKAVVKDAEEKYS
ncbi:hypothetical protein [Mobiluncus curtisii]|uniref:Antitoxin VbhA domain-containing protein n=2 Tax=Mobiluncus curtisii TaxID=2051 RepID=D6ZI34_MOBCV|nr:hypothetical protein [Mobiluncus curtisii]ADI66383.1 hypothetical protein HMPREF0573_10064 [Mobiluncus curtisii ATCC 43063]QQU08085.1 hypothetical protein I6I85_06375 [Mobiluncus curtisii]SQB64283.1 Uncharacterised protein [Mobiluncus curtisii]